MAIVNNGTRFKTKTGKKYYISADNTENFETYSVFSFTDNSDFVNKTGTLIYTEKIRNLKKGATDDLIDDNATLIDEYGSIDFLNTVRNQVIKWVLQ